MTEIAANRRLLAGAGITTITPPLGTALIGHFEARAAETVRPRP